MQPPRRIWDGPRALLFGIAFIAGRRPLWPAAAVPAAAAAVLGTGLGALGAWLGASLVLRHGPPSVAGTALTLLAVLAGVAGFLLGLLGGISLAVPASGPALERIARAVHEELGQPSPPGGGLRATLSSLGATLLGLAVGGAGVALLALLGLLLPPLTIVTVPLKVALISLVVVWDLTDHTFTCYGLTIRQRAAWLRANLSAALAFGWLASLLLCVPVLGLLVLPMGVAGAARLTAGLHT
jgi:CysZ protein